MCQNADLRDCLREALGLRTGDSVEEQRWERLGTFLGQVIIGEEDGALGVAEGWATGLAQCGRTCRGWEMERWGRQ